MMKTNSKHHPALFPYSKPDARRFSLRPAGADRWGHKLHWLIRLSDGARYRICDIFPWRAGRPIDKDSWCASAWHEVSQPKPKDGFGAFKDYDAFRARCDLVDGNRRRAGK